MTQNLPTIPSLLDIHSKKNSAVAKGTGAALALRPAAAVLRSLGWLGYPLSVIVAWQVLPPLLPAAMASAAWIIGLVVMFIGFGFFGRLTRQLGKRIRVSPVAGKSHKMLLPGSYEEVFEFLDATGFDAAARDARVVVRAANNFLKDKSEILSILDDSLRYHLQFLVKVAGIVQTIHDDFLDREESTRAHGQTDRHPRRRHRDRAPHSGGLIKIGKLEIGDGPEFSGIKWGDIEIGERRRSSKPAIILQGPPSEIPEHLSQLAQSAQNSVQEIHFLRMQCEDLLAKSVQGDLERATVTLRERLAREKRILDELNEIKASPERS